MIHKGASVSKENSQHRGAMGSVVKRAEISARRRASRSQMSVTNEEEGGQTGVSSLKGLDPLKVINEMSKQLAIDEKVGLPYGFSFDEFILRLRESLNKQETGSYTVMLKDVISQMGYLSEKEMLEFQKYVIINRTKNNFMQTARELIAFRLSSAILKVRFQTSEGESATPNLGELKELEENVARVMAEKTLNEKVDFMNTGNKVFKENRTEMIKNLKSKLVKPQISDRLLFADLKEATEDDLMDTATESTPEGFFTNDEYMMDDKTFEMSRFNDHVRGKYFKSVMESISGKKSSAKDPESDEFYDENKEVSAPESLFNLTQGRNDQFQMGKW